MLKHIKSFIAKTKEKIKYDRCYNRMEKRGVAIFCMCSGREPSQCCYNCPYFIPNVVKESE